VWVTRWNHRITGQRCDIGKQRRCGGPEESTDEVMRRPREEASTGAWRQPDESWGGFIGHHRYPLLHRRLLQAHEMIADGRRYLRLTQVLSISAWYSKPGFEVKSTKQFKRERHVSTSRKNMMDFWFHVQN